MGLGDITLGAILTFVLITAGWIGIWALCEIAVYQWQTRNNRR